MGTRGLVGVQEGGVIRGCYNHYDSYPDCLGMDFVTAVDSAKEKGLEALKERLGLIEWATESNKQEANRLIAYLYGSVSSDGFKLQDLGNFIENTLFCEWAYVINLDNDTLDIYHRELTPTARISLNENSIKDKFKEKAKEFGWHLTE
jgi:hypothetical protein